MKSGYLFCLVLLIVLAIPLFADHTLVNTVSEFSAISTINREEELPIRDIASPYREITGIKPEIPLYIITKSGLRLNKYGISGLRSVNTKNTIHGGVKRTNLRKH